jgi:hypothetical protein
MPNPDVLPTEDQEEVSATVTMTAAELEQLLERVAREAAASGGVELPPGSYRKGGRVWRKVWVPAAGRVNPQTGQQERGMRAVERPVRMVYDTTREGLLKAQDEAYNASPQQDVYHPDYGWLRFGRKREVDVEANLGAESDDGDVVYVPVGDGVRESLPLPPAPETTAPPETGKKVKP